MVAMASVFMATPSAGHKCTVWNKIDAYVE
jgi:hypothetical protein